MMEIIGTTVKVVCTVVLYACVLNVFAVESRTLKTVGITANGGTVSGTVSIAVIVTQNNVTRITGRIRNKETDECCAVIRDRCGDISVDYGE